MEIPWRRWLGDLRPFPTLRGYRREWLGRDLLAASVYTGTEPLTAKDVAECIRWTLSLPDHVNIDEMIVKCRDQASHTGAKVHRKA